MNVQPSLFDPPRGDCPMCDGTGRHIPINDLWTYVHGGGESPCAHCGTFMHYTHEHGPSRCRNCGGSGTPTIPF